MLAQKLIAVQWYEESSSTKDPDLIGLSAGCKQRRGKGRDFLKGKPLLIQLLRAIEEAHLKLKKRSPREEPGVNASWNRDEIENHEKQRFPEQITCSPKSRDHRQWKYSYYKTPCLSTETPGSMGSKPQMAPGIKWKLSEQQEMAGLALWS